MKIFGYSFFEKVEENSTTHTAQPQSYTYEQADVAYGPAYPIVHKKYDGEKTLGELGVVIRDIPDYERLRLRSYHAYATIDTVKIIASKFFYWTIGSGLKLQAEPNRTVLKSEGILNVDTDYTEFQKMVEARFMVYANSKQCDYLKEKNLHELALDFYQSSFLGGDCLAIARFDDNGPNVQFVSGEFIQSPSFDNDFFAQAEKNGNFIQHGIEIDNTGKHIAYFVKVKQKDKLDTYERIPAIGAKSGKRLAWLISGKKISPDHLRAVPAMAQSLEKINKLDRYTEAAVHKAEQSANVVHTVEHEDFSTGETPLEKVVAQKRGNTILPDGGYDKVAADGLANKIAQTTNGLAFNMVPGAKLKSFESTIETNFKDFNETIFGQVSAGMDVPPEVAMQSYNSNYSASRAAINSFGYIITINRQDFANKFYIPFYKLWLEHQILEKKIVAKGYIENIDNFMVTESYTQCRFTGKNMPHIDPLKEIKAVREMLGIDGAVPLISREQATEMLNAGQWDENFMKSLEEENIIPKEDLLESKKLTDNNQEKV
ncbi:MAG: phage portal protein [bacterium]|jgi:capsid protein